MRGLNFSKKQNFSFVVFFIVNLIDHLHEKLQACRLVSIGIKSVKDLNSFF